MGSRADKPSRARILVAFLLVYVVWGSTYLAIRFAIETLPPLLMAGIRFLLSGLILYAWARFTGNHKPTRTQWRNTAIIGGCLLLGGNGAVVYAEQTVLSGVAALLVATVPLWMVVLEWLWLKAAKPTAVVIIGIILGITGVGFLAGPGSFLGQGGFDPFGIKLLLAASVSWSVGSLYSKRADLPASSSLTTAMEMLMGGLLLCLVGGALGEFGRVNLSTVSAKSALSLLYLIVFGSLVGFTAYLWLLRTVSVASVSTYAYVNPVIAVLLGAVFARELITGRMAFGASLIIVGVALIVSARMRRTGKRKPVVGSDPVPANT